MTAVPVSAVAGWVPVGVVPGPVRVVRVDADEPLPSVSPWRDGGPDYVAALVVVVRSGRPLGHVELALDGRVVGPSELRERLVAGLGDVWESPVAGVVVADVALPSVTVVVPTTFDRVDLLRRCVASLLAQDYPVFDVVVVDNRPEDSPRRRALWSRLMVDGRVSVVAQERPGSSAARNRGAQLARGEVVAFTDDDVEVESGWLRALGGRFAVEPRTDCVTGLVLPKELETPAQIWFERSGSNLDRHVDLMRYHIDEAAWRGRLLGGLRRTRFQVTAGREDGTTDEFLAYRSGRLGTTASMGIRVEAFRALGGFDEALGPGRPAMTGEDHLLLVRLLFAGRRVTLDPAAYVFHTHRRGYDELRRQLQAYGCGYTAMLTALLRTDPRHAVGLCWYALQAGVLFVRKFRGQRAPAAGYPTELSKAELHGLLAGPRAYLRSRRDTGRWSRPVPTPGVSA